ncbi:MAG: aminopeptidase P family protein [Clostridia bacterium]|nr:aminopeptidase P family protein [Clostridia bacterium]
MQKIAVLAENLKKSSDAALIFSEVNRRYYTDFPSSDGCLLVCADGFFRFWTDSRYTEAAGKVITACDVCDSTDLAKQLNEIFKEKNIKKVSIEADRMTVAEYKKWCKDLPDVTLDDSDALTKLIEEQRMVKSEEEISLILAAQKIAEDAFDYILGEIKVGKTEKEIQLALDYYMLSHGAEALSFETICVSGANSSMPHGVPTDKKIESGDFLTMDYGAVVNGYHSDMTRTVFVGTPTEEQKEVYNTVLAAQLASLEALKDGVTGKDADKAGRDIIEAAGYGKNFGHGTGHGVGIEIHEEPRVSPKSPHTLHTGHVVTVEPGIYLPGKFGVRIEDMAVITENGCRNLTTCPKELICL